MDSSVSPKDEIWFLRVCDHISNAVYTIFLSILRLTTRFIVMTKLPKSVLRRFLHTVCTCLGNRSKSQAIFVPFKKLAGVEDTASIIHPKQVHHSYPSMILFSLFEGQLHISRSKVHSSLSMTASNRI